MSYKKNYNEIKYIKINGGHPNDEMEIVYNPPQSKSNSNNLSITKSFFTMKNILLIGIIIGIFIGIIVIIFYAIYENYENYKKKKKK